MRLTLQYDSVSETGVPLYSIIPANAGQGLQEVVDAESHDAEVARLKALLEAETAGAALVRGEATIVIDELESEIARLKQPLYECPTCSFTFLRIHDDADGSGRFSCPNCAEAKLTARAQRLESENTQLQAVAAKQLTELIEANDALVTALPIGAPDSPPLAKRIEFLLEQLRKAEERRTWLGGRNAELRREIEQLRSAVAPFVEAARWIFDSNYDPREIDLDDWRALVAAYDTGEEEKR